jgi:hypothetical protein
MVLPVALEPDNDIFVQEDEEHSSISMLASSSDSLSQCLENCESMMEAQFESFFDISSVPPTANSDWCEDDDVVGSHESSVDMFSESFSGGHMTMDDGEDVAEEDGFLPDGDEDGAPSLTLLLESLHRDEITSRHKKQIDKLHPVEEELLILMRKNLLPIKLYRRLMAWAKMASTSNYDFNSPTYKTVLDRMKKNICSRQELRRCAAWLLWAIPSLRCTFTALVFYTT